MDLSLFDPNADFLAAKLVDARIQSDEHDLHPALVVVVVDEVGQSLVGCIARYWNILLDLGSQWLNYFFKILDFFIGLF